MPPDADRREDLARVEERIGYRFTDVAWLDVALTHRSWANENQQVDHYERLEFLGDSVLGLFVAEWLFRELPEASEGEIASRHGYLVSAPVLTRIARHLGLGSLLRFGVGEERSGGREKESLLADTVESLLGAVFLDGGWAAVDPVARPWFEVELERSARASELAKGPKTLLQERLQASGRSLPEYRVVSEKGPDHAKTFVVECWVGEERLGFGSGVTKKKAERSAARMALEALD